MLSLSIEEPNTKEYLGSLGEVVVGTRSLLSMGVIWQAR